MTWTIITNNEWVQKHLGNKHHIVFIDGSDKEVLTRVRGLVQQGHLLLTAPLSGSVKPGETPFRSIMISREAAEYPDPQSLSIIEESVLMTDRFKVRHSNLSQKKLDDFRLIDLSLLESALESAAGDSVPFSRRASIIEKK